MYLYMYMYVWYTCHVMCVWYIPVLFIVHVCTHVYMNVHDMYIHRPTYNYVHMTSHQCVHT